MIEFLKEYYGIICFLIGSLFGGMVMLVFMCCLYYARSED